MQWGVWAVIPLRASSLGFALPRWWIAAAALPFGSYIVLTNELEGNVGLWVASLLGAARLRDHLRRGAAPRCTADGSGA